MTRTDRAVESVSEEVVEVSIPVPDDWHVHLRDDDMLDAVVDHTAQWFRYALVMPNLTPPIVSVDQAVAYRDRILAAVSAVGGHFEPLMTLYLTADLAPAEVRAGWETGSVAGVKFYPAGATTNSEAGGTSLLQFADVLETMSELGMPLFVHAESTDPALDVFDREAAFLENQVAPLLERLPALSVTVEHLSTSHGVDLVRSFEQAFGSITPHHLACDRSDILANGMRPELYCKPVINSAAHKRALVEAAISGDPKFFLGTDSAPHPLSAKETRVAKAGIFNAPYALHVTAEVFHRAGALDRLGAFTSINGALRYGRPIAEDSLVLHRHEVGDEVPGTITTSTGDRVRLFGVDEAARWTISRLPGPTG